MNQAKRRSTYQYGTLTQESRRRGSDVWVYRYFETINGKKSRRKRIVGTVEEYPTRAAAERACEHVRMAANAETTTPESPSLGGLIDRYIEQVLRPCLDVPLGGGQDEFAQISYHCAKSYKSALNRWVRPRWETYRVREFEQASCACRNQGLAQISMAVSQESHGLAPKMVRSFRT
jgi:integrase